MSGRVDKHKKAGEQSAESVSPRIEPQHNNLERPQTWGQEVQRLERIALVVTGMHRSGTSAITRVLSYLGADLPETLMAPNDYNPAGYWEPLDLVQLHDEMLSAAGSSWDDLGLIEPFWESTQFMRPFRESIGNAINKDYGDSPFFVIKDPRISRFVPATVSVLHELDIKPYFVIAIRNPLEVAASLKQRNDFSFSKSFLLWLDHTLNVERSTRGMPRTFVPYEEFIQDWREAMKLVAHDLNLTFPEWSTQTDIDIDTFVSQALKHHAYTAEDIIVREDVAEWIKESYRAIYALAKKEGQGKQQKLDRIYRNYSTAKRAFGPVLAKERLEKVDLTRQLKQAQIETAELERQSRAEQQSKERISSKLDRVSGELNKQRAEVEQYREDAELLLKELAYTRSIMMALQGKLERIYASDSWRVTRPLRGAAWFLRKLLQKIRSAIKVAKWLCAGQVRRAGKVLTSNCKKAIRSVRKFSSANRKGSTGGQRSENKAIRGNSGKIGTRRVRGELGRQTEITDTRKRAEVAAKSRQWARALSLWQKVLKYELTAKRPLSGDIEMMYATELFDPEWYAATYPDVKMLGMDPAEHYARLGGKLGRNPSRDFDAYYYLQNNRDVAEADLNPLLHYLRHGKYEGRNIARVEDARMIEPADTGSCRAFAGYIKLVPGARCVLAVAHKAGEKLYGGERSFLDILDSFAEMNINVVAVLPEDTDLYTREARRRSCETIIFEYPWWRDNQPSVEATRVFERIIVEKQVDAVHVNTIMLREPLIAAKNRGVAAVLHVREIIEKDKWLRVIIGEDANTIIKESLDRADWIIANSKATAESFHKEGRTLVVPNTVDLEIFDIDNEIESDEIKFGILSSNIAKKGIHDVIELAIACNQSVPNARFIIIGPQTRLIRDLQAKQAGGEIPANVEFHGYVNSPQSAIEKVNVIINFSHFAESFGRTVLEAMAARRPVIAYDWGAIPELVKHGKTGFLVPYREPGKAVVAVKELCADPECIVKMGREARLIAEQRYSREKYIEEMNAAYYSIFADQDRKIAGRRPESRAEKRHLRIAYFCWHFPVPSETFVLNELRYLIDNDYDVRVFCRHSPYQDFVPDVAVSSEQVSSPEHLAQRLTETGRTHVHAHFTYPTVTEFVWPACEDAKVKFTFIAHSQDIFRYDRDSVNNIDRITRSPWCTRVVVPGNFHKDYLIERRVANDKIVIIPQGIDAKSYPLNTDKERLIRSVTRICTVQRFVEKKGLDSLILAAKGMEADGVEINIYGYGPLEEHYLNVIRKNGINNVNIKGAIEDRHELIQIFAEHDLFVSPSMQAENGDMDGIPTVLMEAMACGLPVVTTPISSIPDLVRNNANGLYCQPDSPDSIISAVSAYNKMPSLKREALIEEARATVIQNYDTEVLQKRLLDLWNSKTVDLIIVSWNNLPELKEVINRIQKHMSMPYRLVICDNNSEQDVVEYLRGLDEEYLNISVIYQDHNSYVGPGTNTALNAGTSQYAIYICGKEGFALQPNWERPMIEYMDKNPEVGIAGTLCYSPSYLTGKDYIENLEVFARFRNQGYARNNPERVFKHVQGGLFILRRKMYEEIGGFSEAVPHSHTDVEYSYYAESCGWRLGKVPEMLALFNKTRPGILSRIDEHVRIVHPASIEIMPTLDQIACREKAFCNICEWKGEDFNTEIQRGVCPDCASEPADRTLWRYLAESTLTYRRLPTMSVNLGRSLHGLWKHQFQGRQIDYKEIIDEISKRGKIDSGGGSMQVIYLNNALLPDNIFTERLLSEVVRILSDDGILLIRNELESRMNDRHLTREMLYHLLKKFNIKIVNECRYTSSVIEYDYQPLLVCHKSR